MTEIDPIAAVRAALENPRAASSDYDLSENIHLPPGRKLRPAGVLVPLINDADGVRVILTKRSSMLKHHPGQIAFPGGKQDPEDADITATALREASEEIGLAPSNVEVMGRLPEHETVTNFVITPIVAQVMQSFIPKPEAGEVDEVFEVPLEHLLDTSRYLVQSRYWRKTRRYYYTVPFGPYYVWGATARILRSLADAAATR